MAKKNHVNEAAVAIQKNSSAIKRAAKGMQGYERMGEGLANLNTMRGAQRASRVLSWKKWRQAEPAPLAVTRK